MSETLKLSAIELAELKGIEDAQSKKPTEWQGEWSEEKRAYLRAYQNERGKVPFTEEEKIEIVKQACGCLSWDRWNRERGFTDEELAKYLSHNMSEGGKCGPGILSIDHNGSGLKIYASWTTVCPSYNGDLICEGIGTVKRARIAYDIKDPSNNQIDLF